jgi:hypothetical protein
VKNLKMIKNSDDKLAKSLTDLLQERKKPMVFSQVRKDQNQIIEVQDDYRRVRHLPPLKMTEKAYEKRLEREHRQYGKWLKNFIETKHYLEHTVFPKIKIYFGANYP